MLNETNAKSILASEINTEDYIFADWPAPKNVKALMTTRKNGFSHGQFKAFNLATHVDDDLAFVKLNRQKLKQLLKLKFEPFWLEQTHTNHCVKWQDFSAVDNKQVINADASYSDFKEQACVVMTADCLPILITNQQGTWVAACHAGWRGLADGIIQNTIKHYPGAKTDLLAWIGPAISQSNFEVGVEVKEQFAKLDSNFLVFFKANQNSRYQFDYIGLARLILSRFGISVYGGNLCNFKEQQKFYSYRRDNQTGRMASLIWFE